MRLLSMCLFLLSVSLGAAALPQDGSGLWWVSHGDGAPLQLRLYADGTAWSDYPSNNPGTWSRRDHDIVCRWADGWSEVLRPAEGGWIKLGFKPGTDVTDRPTNLSRAFPASPRPDGWFGASPRK